MAFLHMDSFSIDAHRQELFQGKDRPAATVRVSGFAKGEYVDNAHTKVLGRDGEFFPIDVDELVMQATGIMSIKYCIDDDDYRQWMGNE